MGDGPAAEGTGALVRWYKGRGNGLRDHRRELPAELPDGAGSSRKTACARSPGRLAWAGRRRHRPTRDDPRARHRRGSLL